MKTVTFKVNGPLHDPGSFSFHFLLFTFYYLPLTFYQHTLILKQYFPITSLSDRALAIILGAAWLIAQVFAFWKYGIVTSVDSEVYIGDAQMILDGDWPTGRNLFYSGYSMLVADMIFLMDEPRAVVIYQVIASGIAAVCLYKLTKSVAGNATAAIIATTLYVLWPEIHQWNMIVYTDSLFTNSVVITITLLHFVKRWPGYVITFLMVVITVFMRPVGIIFLVALFNYLGWGLFQSNRIDRWAKVFLISGTAAIALFIINAVLREHSVSFLSSYAKAEIIYPGITLGLTPPDASVMPDSKDIALWQLTVFIFQNPIYFAKLFLVKSFMFVAHVKPYYSILHNAAIIIFFLPVYYFAIKGMRRFPNGGLKTFISLFVFLQIIMVGMTSENWDGRFLLPLMPWLFVLAAVGAASQLVKEIGQRRT